MVCERETDLRRSGVRLLACSTYACQTQRRDHAPELTKSRGLTGDLRMPTNPANSFVVPGHVAQKVRDPRMRFLANQRTLVTWVTRLARPWTTQKFTVVFSHPTFRVFAGGIRAPRETTSLRGPAAGLGAHGCGGVRPSSVSDCYDGEVLADRWCAVSSGCETVEHMELAA